MKTLQHWLIRRFYPGTLEEFYAAREIQRREARSYRRRAPFIAGAVGFGVPMLIIVFSGVLPLGYKILWFIAVWGVACLRETVAEHYSLQLLRRERGEPQT